MTGKSGPCDDATLMQQIRDALAEDVLDSEYPIEWVEQELREAGFDPEKIGKDCAELMKKLRKENAS